MWDADTRKIRQTGNKPDKQCLSGLYFAPFSATLNKLISL